MALTEEIMLILGARYVGGGAMSALIGDSRRLASSISTAESGMSRAAVASSRMDAAYTAGTISALKHSQALDVLAAKQAAVTVASAKYAAAQSSLAQQHAKVASPLTGMVAGNAAQARAIADQAAASERLSIATRAVTTNEQAQLAAHSALLRSEVSRNVAMDAATATGASADSVKILEAAELSLIRAKNGVSLADQRQIDLIFKQIAADDALVQANTLVSSRSAELTAITKAETEALAVEVKMTNDAAAANLRLGASKRSATSARMGAISTAGGLDSSVSGIANAEAGVAAASIPTVMGIPLTAATAGWTGAGVAAIALSMALRTAVVDATAFNKAEAQVAAQTGNTFKSLQGVGSTALDFALAGKAYYSPEQMVRGTQLPLSAGMSTEAIAPLMKAMGTISKMTEQSDLTVVAQTVATAQNALFGGKATVDQMKNYLDIVARTEQLAPRAPGEILAALPNLYASAQGVNLDPATRTAQLHAALLLTTQQGIGASDATHWMGMAMRSLVYKPSATTQRVADSMGIKIGQEGVNQAGGSLVGYFQNLYKELGANTAAGQRLAAAFTSSGTGGILSMKEFNILGDPKNAVASAKLLSDLLHAAGVADKVSNTLDESFGNKWSKIENQFGAQLTLLGIAVTDKVIPPLLLFAQAIVDVTGLIPKGAETLGGINDRLKTVPILGGAVSRLENPINLIPGGPLISLATAAYHKVSSSLGLGSSALSGGAGSSTSGTVTVLPPGFIGPLSSNEMRGVSPIDQQKAMDILTKHTVALFNNANAKFQTQVVSGGANNPAALKKTADEALLWLHRPATMSVLGAGRVEKDTASIMRTLNTALNAPLLATAKANMASATTFQQSVLIHKGSVQQQNEASSKLKGASDSYANSVWRASPKSKQDTSDWQSLLLANLDTYNKNLTATWGTQSTSLTDQLNLDKAKNLPGAQTTDIKSMISFIKGTPWQQEGYTSSASQQLAILDLQKQLTSVTQSSVPGAQLIRPNMSTINDVMPSFAGTISHLAGTADPMNEQIRLLKAQLSADQQTIVELRQQVSYLRTIANNTGLTVKQTKPAPSPAPPMRPPAFIHPAQGLGG